MADTAIVEAPIGSDPVKGKKAKGRKALKPKSTSTSEANILAGAIAEEIAPLVESSVGKENHEKKAKKSKQQSKECFEKELQEMKDKIQQLRLEKEKAEELLKEKDEMLQMKEEELETLGREQEKLQMEFKKLQKMKEFNPTMTLSIVEYLREKDEEKKEKKKMGCPDIKRPTGSYLLWSREHWNEVKKEKPDVEFKEIAQILGEKWKTLSAEEKRPYEEKYQAEKEAYLKIAGNEKREHEAMKLLAEEQKQRTAMELLEQYLQFKQETEKDTKKSKKEKDPLKPKRPCSAYFLYMNERRGAILAESKSILEVSKITGEEWNSMTEKQKRPYEKVTKKKLEKYAHEMEVYRQNKEEEADNHRREEDEMMKIQKQEALQLLKKKEKTDNIIKKTKEDRKKMKKEKIDDPLKPKRPASSFILFGKEERMNLAQERPGINKSNVNALISVKWKELGEEEKRVWNEKAAEAMEAYKKEMEEYNKLAKETTTK